MCQVHQPKSVLNLVSSMWTWTVSLCLWGFEIDQILKASHVFVCLNVLSVNFKKKMDVTHSLLVFKIGSSR